MRIVVCIIDMYQCQYWGIIGASGDDGGKVTFINKINVNIKSINFTWAWGIGNIPFSFEA